MQDNIYKTIYQNAPYGVFIADARGFYMDVNSAAEKLTGYSRDELLKMNFSDMFFPEDENSSILHLRMLIETGSNYGELPYRDRDGAKRWWSVAAEKLNDDLFIAFCYEITERINQQQLIDITDRKLQEANEEYYSVNEELNQINEELKQTHEISEKERNEKELILNSISDMVIFHDIHMNVVWTNNSAAANIGKARHMIEGNPCFESFGENPTEKCHDCPVIIALQEKRPYTARKKRHDGKIWDIRAYPAYDTEGNLTGIVETMTDVTKLLEAEKKLTETNARYEAIMKAFPDMLFVLDEGGYYRDYFFVDEYSLITSPENFLNKNMAEIMPEPVLSFSRNSLDLVLKTGSKTSYKYHLDIHEGRAYFEATMVKMDNNRVLTVIRNITRQEENEKSLIEKIEELEKFNRIMIDREERMLELKDEVNQLMLRLGLPAKYKAPGESRALNRL